MKKNIILGALAGLCSVVAGKLIYDKVKKQDKDLEFDKEFDEEFEKEFEENTEEKESNPFEKLDEVLAEGVPSEEEKPGEETTETKEEKNEE